MNYPRIKVPHPRPRKLSDPFSDHQKCVLAGMLAKLDRELEWRDYQAILGPFLPAGEYKESAYFLQLAFDHLIENEKDAYDLLTAVFGFAAKQSEYLTQDGVMGAVQGQILRCLEHWTASFEILEGTSGQPQSYVRHGYLLIEALSELMRFKVHADLATSFVGQLATQQTDVIRSAWYLWLASAYVVQDISFSIRHEPLNSYFEDDAYFIMHKQIVRNELKDFDPDSAFWQATLML